MLVLGVLVVAVVAAYHATGSVPFIFDDIPAIVENPTIRSLRASLTPPNDTGVTVNGRPLVNFSFALNYAIGGTDVRGYHAVNLAIHLGATLLLFGIVRRTLLLPALSARFASSATGLAGAVAGLWALHPLQTESVTYIVQRAESLMALFFLLTLYGFIRGVTTGVRGWLIGAWFACVLGMATKEVMVAAPVVVLFYDRTFLGGSFREAWRRRGVWHVAFALTWGVLAWMMMGAGDRGGSAGFGMGVAWWEYAMTQVHAVTHYLRLALWPDPLVLDYQMPVVRAPSAIVGAAVVLSVLVGATAVAIARRWRAGFLGVVFFAILAPSSSVVPLADTMFEHRMYLPLAAVVAAVVFAIHLLSVRAAWWIFPVMALALGWGTVRRNHDYRSEESIWRDTVAKRPENVRARYTLGTVLFHAGRVDEAMTQYQRALELDPESPPTHVNLANALARSGRLPEAITHYRRALATAPHLAEAHTNLGNVLAQTGEWSEAATHLERAVALRPGSAEARNNLGNLLVRRGRLDEASVQWEEALRLRPDFVPARINLGNLDAQRGDLAGAIAHYEMALRVAPDHTEAHYNLGTALALAGRSAEAIPHFEVTLRLDPAHEGARKNLPQVRRMSAVPAPLPPE